CGVACGKAADVALGIYAVHTGGGGGGHPDAHPEVPRASLFHRRVSQAVEYRQDGYAGHVHL
ncbi:hypothetical protein IW143_005161, partial [Coemansia sp. RSA 520]